MKNILLAKMLSKIDEILNKVTMYKLILYYLAGLIAAAAFFGFLGKTPYNPFDILLNTIVALFFCWGSNYVFAKLSGVVVNTESSFITALILVLIVPVKFPADTPFLALISSFAMGAKYLLTVEKRHVFNPAAVSVAAIAFLFPEHIATWWVGTSVMAPFVLFGGYLMLRKIRRETMVLIFLGSYLVIIITFLLLRGGLPVSIFSTLRQGILHSPLLFFGFVMLTEPSTLPPTKSLRSYYAALVALFYATPQIRLLGFAFTPEMALCIGNIYSYIVSPQYRFTLPLKEKIQLSRDTYAFIFDRASDFKFRPGQYMEWMLPHTNVDSRGNRRYFSLASSPTELNPAIAVKFYTPSSSYKKVLLKMEKGQQIIASQLSGDFTLPKDLTKPLAFIAGGVGVTPFCSMVRYIIDNKIKCDIILLYAAARADDILYGDIFEKAKEFGVKTVYTVSDTTSLPAGWQGNTGYITEEMVRREIPDFAARKFYISGPLLMVENFEAMLGKMDVKKGNIVVDYFPGYAEKK